MGKFAEEKDLELAFSIYARGDSSGAAELADDVMKRIKAKTALIQDKSVGYSETLELCSVAPTTALTFTPDKEYLLGMSHV